MSPSSFPPQAPSSGRPLPICRVPWGKFPDLTGTISRLRLLAPRRASLRFLRSALPPLRPLRSPGAGRFPRGPGPLLPRRPRRLCTVEKTRPPRFLGDPCVHAPLFDPGGPPVPGHYRTGDVVFRTLKDVDSALPISRLNHAACTLSVYASQPGSPPDHATLDSGRWPALTGQDFHLLGRVEGFRHVCPSTWLPPSPSFAWRNKRFGSDLTKTIRARGRQGLHREAGHTTVPDPHAAPRSTSCLPTRGASTYVPSSVVSVRSCRGLVRQRSGGGRRNRGISYRRSGAGRPFR